MTAYEPCNTLVTSAFIDDDISIPDLVVITLMTSYGLSLKTQIDRVDKNNCVVLKLELQDHILRHTRVGSIFQNQTPPPPPQYFNLYNCYVLPLLLSTSIFSTGS